MTARIHAWIAAASAAVFPHRRLLRGLLAFVVGLILGGWSVWSIAETIPATNLFWARVYKFVGGNVVYGPTIRTSDSNGAYKLACEAAGSYIQNNTCMDGWSQWHNGWEKNCPTGQGWTYNSTAQTCTRPDCAPGETRGPGGQCVPQQCPSSGSQYSSGYYLGEAPSYACSSNGCGLIFSGVYPVGRDADGNLYSQGSYNYSGGNVGECVPGQHGPQVAETATADTSSTNPPCAPGDGVMTKSDGSVACVPANAPGAESPKKNSESSTKTYSDGSSTTTTTTQVCTGDGACSSTTTVSTSAASNGQPGQAGTPGTTTEQTDKPAEDDSGFCAKNPNLQICKGDMGKEETQLKVLDEIKKLTTPEVEDDSAITGATHSEQSQQDLEAKEQEITDAATGALDPVSSSKSAWQQAMESGWFSPIPESNCSPYTATISGRTWTLDYCPTAAKISEIAGYVMWFMLAVGSFVMLTGGRRET